MAKTKQPDIGVMTVTPQMAAKWLERNTHNRNLRDRQVNRLRDIIARGEWRLNGDPIRFSDTGVLLDGQHRLWAIMLEETPVECVVIEGLPTDTQLTIDQGAKRNLSDVLKLQGKPSSVMLASVINTKWRLDNGVIRTGMMPTIPQALEMLDKHPDLIEAIPFLNKYKSRFQSTAGVGVLWYEFSQIDPDAADDFFDRLITGTGLKKGDPVYVLRRRLETAKFSGVMLMALIIKAWNAYMEGVELTNLIWRPVGKAAEAFPQIHG